jgi:hypothetical protein
MANSDSDGAAPGGRGRRKILIWMTALLVVVVLAVVGFVTLRPAKTASATQDAEKNPAARRGAIRVTICHVLPFRSLPLIAEISRGVRRFRRPGCRQQGKRATQAARKAGRSS